MVQGGYANVVLSPNDSVERHFQDTMVGGHWLNNHILARTLVEDAPVVVHEMWEKAGVRFMRDKDGNLHEKGLAGLNLRSHGASRRPHRYRNRLASLGRKSRARGTRILEECRAVDLLVEDGEVFGAVLLPARTGEFLIVRAKITVLATGGAVHNLHHLVGVARKMRRRLRTCVPCRRDVDGYGDEPVPSDRIDRARLSLQRQRHRRRVACRGRLSLQREQRALHGQPQPSLRKSEV